MEPVSNTLSIVALATRSYGAYGQSGVSIDSTRAGFAGEIREADLPWYLMGERFYVPALRRFTSPDPASPFDAGGLNRYAYCSGDPINRIDPTGENWLNWVLLGVSVVISIAALASSGIALAGAVAAAKLGASAITGVSFTPTIVTLSAAVVVDSVSIVAEAGIIGSMITKNEEAQGIFGAINVATGIARFGFSFAPDVKWLGKFTKNISDRAIHVIGRRARMRQFVGFTIATVRESLGRLQSDPADPNYWDGAPDDDPEEEARTMFPGSSATKDTTAFKAIRDSSRRHHSSSAARSAARGTDPTQFANDASARYARSLPGGDERDGFLGSQTENPLGGLPSEIEKSIFVSRTHHLGDRTDDRALASQISHPERNTF